ncbi:hypothetical protein PENANT_c024G09672 [Penicillium antarcticum]|uniref:RING-type E3 ubiquitin transferase n=1 Tax=Penicillium antarcticum TaxID=416450 RepID=A0A1V6PY70_9EURO|nr:hypothetical protein PENANT_c024G09672 [Penicillium antarcticum]
MAFDDAKKELCSRKKTAEEVLPPERDSTNLMDDEVRQQILQRTLQEVDEESDVANPCVICLDKITEPCVAQPCHHANFDFLCLVSWLEQQPTCPLCKSELIAVKYELQAPQGPKLYKVPPRNAKPPAEAAPRSRPGPRRGPRGGHTFLQPPRPQLDDPLERRRNVYRNQTYSMRVGTNRLSQYREMTPELFNRDEELASRARKWIRRELKVFSFLNPETEEEERAPQQVSRPGHQRLESRRANNAEFLLEYVIAILRTVDLKGSAGQAEELLRDFIGRENARLFIHELQAIQILRELLLTEDEGNPISWITVRVLLAIEAELNLFVDGHIDHGLKRRLIGPGDCSMLSNDIIHIDGRSIWL